MLSVWYEPLSFGFYNRDTVEVAKDILGKLLVFSREVTRVARIVETEAYLRNDPASHSYRGETRRNRSMFKGPGTLYVFTLHRQHCLNVVTRVGEAVLLRAAEPVKNVEGRTSGPGLLSRALGIDASYDGHSLLGPPIYLSSDGYVVREIVQTTRIGVTRARELPLRFYVKGSKFVSKP